MRTETNPVAVAKPQSKPQTLRDLIQSDAFRDQVAAALPKHITAERMLRIFGTAVLRTPKLKDCDLHSVSQAFLSCSQFGLEPDGRHAHLIPYGTTCTLVIDYKGLVDLLMRTGNVSCIHADVVCENDTFDYDTGEIKSHRIDFKKPRGAVYAVYSIITFKDGSRKCEVMTKDEVEAIRRKSKGANAGPWSDHWNEMAKKTVFKRATKWCQISPELRDAIAADDAEHAEVNVTPTSVPPIFKMPAELTTETTEEIK